MENLVIPCNFKLPVSTIPSKASIYASESPLKPTFKPTISLSAETRVNSHLNSLCKEGRIYDAVSGLDAMVESGSKLAPGTYMNLLQSCIDTNSIELGRKLHARIGIVEDVNPFVETKLVSMYAKCGYLDDARRVFDGMRERNLFTWSAMIGAFSRKRKWKQVLELFFRMVRDGTLPDRFLFPKILEACGHCGDIEATKAIHSLVVRCGICGSVRISNSILAVYVKFGKLNWAMKFFDRMKKRNTVSWNSVISGFCHTGRVEEADRLFRAMIEEGTEPGLVTWNIMIASYNQMGENGVAMGLMKKMTSLGIIPDVFTWTSMISGFAHNSRRNQALESFREMLLAGVEPNAVTIASTISACASLKSLSKGMEIYAFATKAGLTNDVLVGNALVDMHAKCGVMEAAQNMFDSMVERDVYTWNSLIGGYCQAGFCGKANELFLEMQESDVSPNVITWNVMITGYIHSGDEDQAMDLFQRMENDGKVKRNAATWNSLIAGYLHSGEKDKALWMFRNMQFQSHSVVPNLVTVLSVLPACGNLVAAKKVREIHCSILRRSLESELSVVNSLVGTYAKSGDIQYSRTVFDGMITKDIITWNSMISGYVLHVFPNLALDLFDQMKNSGLEPNRGTFLSLIYAYSLLGKVEKGKQTFSSMCEDYHIIPGLEHYSAMVDLFGRAGRFGEAMDFIDNMPLEPDFSVWFALLTASRVHRKIRFAVLAMDNILELEPGNYLIQRLRSQAHALLGKPDTDQKLQQLEKENVKTKKYLGRSWIELENRVFTFFPGDQSEPYLYPWISEISGHMTGKFGFHDGLCLEEEEKEEIGGVHSEKLAIALSLIGFPAKNQCIKIIKSLRMCGDCHETAKYVSELHNCEIYVSDSKCLHRFSNGNCSCRDYW